MKEAPKLSKRTRLYYVKHYNAMQGYTLRENMVEPEVAKTRGKKYHLGN